MKYKVFNTEQELCNWVNYSGAEVLSITQPSSYIFTLFYKEARQD